MTRARRIARRHAKRPLASRIVVATEGVRCRDDAGKRKETRKEIRRQPSTCSQSSYGALRMVRNVANEWSGALHFGTSRIGRRV